MTKLLELSEDQKYDLALSVKKILRDSRGLLAVDERASTIESKFVSCGIENTEENRRKFREFLFKTPGLEDYIGGVILNEETYKQYDNTGKPVFESLLARGVEIGVKLDKGLLDFGNGEKISVGLEDLEERMAKYERAKFFKWRSLFSIGRNTPSRECVEQNCLVLCAFALMAQKMGKVPIIEPEISMKGSFTAKEMSHTAREVYGTLFQQANRMNLFIPGLVMKCSFIDDGRDCENKTETAEVGARNIDVLGESVPRAVGGIVFLSGGHSAGRSFELLRAVHRYNKYKCTPMSFSFCRALTSDGLSSWEPNGSRDEEARSKFTKELQECHEANSKDGCKGED